MKWAKGSCSRKKVKVKVRCSYNQYYHIIHFLDIMVKHASSGNEIESIFSDIQEKTWFARRVYIYKVHFLHSYTDKRFPYIIYR